MTDFKLPELGEDIEEADVLKVLVAEGDTVTADQPLIEIETEKATLEVPSEIAGTITKLHVKQGDTIKVGQLIVTIEEGGAAKPAKAEPEAKAAPAKEAAAEVTPPEAAPAPEAKEKAPEPVAKTEEPAAEDKPKPPAKAAPEKAAAASATPPGTSAFASPSQRKLAREIGVDLGAVQGSGPGGRITDEDIKRASRERPAPAAASSADGTRSVAGFRPLPDFSQWGPVTREHLSRLRRTVARNMSQSWTEIPHVHLHHHADITAMEELRQQY